MSTYQGQILIAQPQSISQFFHRSCVLVAKHSYQGSLGYILNRTTDRDSVRLTDVMVSLGIEHDCELDQAVRVGGPVERSKITVIHSTEWFGPTTKLITADLAMTTDISIMVALSRSQGPELWRAFAGMCMWGQQQLEGEQSGQAPWTPLHRWLTVPADPDLVYLRDGDAQWQHCLEAAVDLEVDHWI